MPHRGSISSCVCFPLCTVGRGGGTPLSRRVHLFFAHSFIPGIWMCDLLGVWLLSLRSSEPSMQLIPWESHTLIRMVLSNFCLAGIPTVFSIDETRSSVIRSGKCHQEVFSKGGIFFLRFPFKMLRASGMVSGGKDYVGNELTFFCANTLSDSGRSWRPFALWIQKLPVYSLREWQDHDDLPWDKLSC